jgi:hypothetical protein
MKVFFTTLCIAFTVVVFLVWLFMSIVEHERKKEAAFMKECMDYGKPHFECQAMYESMQGHSYSVVIPMVVPSGR